MNWIFFAGKVGMDAELRTLPSGSYVLNWKMVRTAGWGDKKHAQWLECSLFGARAEKLAPYIKKGKPMSVGGPCDVRAYSTKHGPGATITCDVKDLELQGTRQAEDRPAAAAEPFDDKKAADVAFDDDVPF